MNDTDRNLANMILRDAEWTHRVVVSAILAARSLNHTRPDGLTPDGDDPAMTARTVLNTALIDLDAIRDVVE